MREPLTPSALLAAISNAQNSTLQLRQLMAICANLVVLDKDCNVIRFAHQSVKEFLERHDSFTGAVAHNFLASTCIEACSRGPVSTTNLQLPSDDFYVYAAMYWPVHSHVAESMAANKDIVDKMTSFIFDEDFDTTLSFDSWLRTRRELVAILANDHAMKAALDAIPDCHAGFLFLISAFGLTGLLRVVFEHAADLDVNQKNKHGHTPVYLAAALGHSTTVSVLVDHGANVNVKCGRYGSPLHAACFAGHLEAVENLLKLGASISYGVVFDNALQAACRGGHEDVALHLIESGSMVKSEDDYEQALEGAARAGFVNVVERLQRPPFLLFNKSKPEKVRRKTRKAIEGGQLGVIRQFLDQQINKKDVLPPDAVALATLYNHKILVQFLLDEGMGVEVEGAVGTPLRTACLLNYQPIARLLLHRGAEINACGIFGDALQAAAMKGHTTVVKLIIDEGANVNQQSGFYGTALQAAAYHGQRSAVELLLDAGADVHAKGYSKDAFHAAAEGGHQDVIMLMLRKGYKCRHQLPGPAFRMRPPSPYKALMRDASPGRDSDPYRRRQSSRASKDIFAKATRPTTELEAIFRAVEGESEMAQLKTEEVPAIGCESRSYSRRGDNYPLEAAASAGHEGTIKLLLEQREVLGISEDKISHAIKVAALNSHLTVVQLLLDDVAKRQPIKSHIEPILEVGRQRQQSQIVDLALARASKHCSADETAELRQKLITAADKYHHDPEVSQETLVLDFADCCKNGDIQVIDAILGSKYHEALSPREIDVALQLCALNSQSTVAQMLLESPSLKGRQPPSGEEAFIVAAGSGSVNMMKLLISYWADELTTTSSVAIIRALVVSSGNGHIDVVRYLVQDMSADINSLAHDKPVGSGLKKRRWALSLFGSLLYDSEGQSEASQEEPAVVPFISPLQAALRGFARFDSSSSHLFGISFDSGNELRKAEQPQHEEVIMFLLGSGSKLNDLGGQNVYPIQLAAKSCPGHIVEKFISAGIDVNATKDGESALFAATGRELSAASIVRRLLAVGTTIPEEVEEQKELLEQGLRYFRGNTSSKNFHNINDPDGHFLVAPSVEYVFNEGSGAVLFDLLHRMPQITTTDIGWTLVLQMAAFLDNHPFLDLLLSRGTEVNAIGYYYGTALEAAARCGHISMIQKLLDAGAEVNVLEGRWQTALRAALVGGHADVVETLLDHGADMELRRTKQRLYFIDSEKDSENALQLGVRSGNLSIVKTLLKHGANVVLDESETLHPLILASTQGSVAMVKELLSAGAPVNIHGKKRPHYSSIQAEDASPIHAAIAGGYLDVIKLLLSQGADIEKNIEGVGTPLSVAASKGRADIVRLLLLAGANVIDSAALSDAVREGSIEIAQELLAAGSKAESALALACRRGRLPMIELLLEKIYDGEKPETVVDEAFAVHTLVDSVFRLLLDYAPPTMRRFVQVCAAGSVASVGIMLDKGGIDINGQGEANGDYPLQVAASHLQAEVVRYLLSSGADMNCKSANHGTPLMTALEACEASTLRSLNSENAKKLVDKLSLPDSGGRMVYYISGYRDSAPISFRQLSDCEKIVRLLVIHGANITDDSRPFGPPLHLACLLGSKALVELLLEKGAGLNSTAGFFEKTIFAAIQGGHLDIVALLLQKAPLTKHIHPEYTTPLHFACAVGSGASVRKLLEHGANATVLDANGRTPLTIALEEKRQRDMSFKCSQTETPLEVILKLANPLHVLDDDLVVAAELNYRDAEKILASLLDIAKGMLVSEAVICRVFKRSRADNQIFKLLMQRSGGIGVTAKMLEAVQTHYDLEMLLKHKPVCRITPDILKSQKELKCMKLLLDIDPEMPVTEGVVFRALEIGNDLDRRYMRHKQEAKDVLETLFDRSPDIAVTEEMVQAVRCAPDMEILLKHLEPGTRISTDVVAAVSKIELEGTYLTMRPLLKFDPSIRLNPKMALQTIGYSDPIDALEMLLEHDPSMSVTEEMFLQIFGQSPTWEDSNREKLADLMHEYGKRLVFTAKVREAVDHTYQSTSEAAKKKRFYSLRVTDEDGVEL
jgi:ankyrin repeat protein